jgi:hypothetical protein
MAGYSTGVLAAHGDEFFQDDVKASPGRSLKNEQEDCDGQLEDFENIVSVFLTYLSNLAMELNRDGQLKGEGYKRIMNLIDDYWKDEEEFEDQE